MITPRGIRLAGALLLLAVLTIGCFSRGDSKAVPPPPTEQAAPATATTNESTAAEADSEADSGTAETTALSAMAQLAIIEDVPSIARYRMRLTMGSEIPDRNTFVEVEAAYIKEPPTEEIVMQVEERGETQTITTYLVDGLRYMRSGDMVVQTADARMNLNELTLIQPRDATVLDDRFSVVGEETLNGRETTHYQGGPDAVPTGSTAGDSFDLTSLASARIDLWVDQAEQFIVAMEVNAEITEGSPGEQIHMRFEYYDFNSPEIVIEAPDDAMAVPGGMPGEMSGAEDQGEPADESATTAPAADTAAPPEPRNALGKLLGFDLLVATGSEINAVSDQIVQVASVYTVDEAVGLFQATLPANGYTFLNLVEPQAGESVLMFQKGMQVATIQITEADSGSDWTVVMAP